MKHNNLFKIFRIIVLVFMLIPFVNAINLTDTQARSIITGDQFTDPTNTGTNYGNNVNVYASSSSTGGRRGFFNFDLMQAGINIDNSIINNAILNLYLEGQNTPSTSYTVGFYFCNDTFDESTLTRDNEATEVVNCDGSPFYTETQTTGTGWKSINITDEIIAYNVNTFTIKVTITPEGSGTLRQNYYSSTEHGTTTLRPRLNINYDLVEPTTNLQDYYNTENISINISYPLSSNITYDMGFYLTKLLGFNNSIVNGITLINDKITLSNTFDTGIVAKYPLTTNSLDYSGNGNDGTEYNGVVATGTHYEFDGVDDYIAINSLEPSIEMSFCGWFIANNLNTGYIWGYGTSDIDRFLFGIKDTTFDLKIYDDIDNSNYEYTYDVNLAYNNWYHYCLISKNDSRKYLYLNSNYISASAAKFPISNLPSTSNYYIGKQVTANYFNGSIADVQIFNRSLTPTEVSNLYNESRKRLGLVLDAPLRDTIEDYSPASNTLTGYNGVIINESGANCDGVNDYIDLNMISYLNVNSSFTVVINEFQNNPTLNGYMLDFRNGYNQGFAIQTTDSGDYLRVVLEDNLGVNINLDTTIFDYDSSINNNIITIVDRKNNLMSLYINGNFIDSENISSISTITYSGKIDICRGGGNAVSNEYYNGTIKDVKIYNRALSESEITDLYNQYNFKESTSTYTNLFNLSDYTNRRYCQIDGTTLDWGTSSTYEMYINGTRQYLNEWFYYNGSTTMNMTFVLYDTNEYEKSFEIKDVSVYCGAEPNYKMKYVLWDNSSTSGTLNLFNLTEGGHELNLYLNTSMGDYNYSYSFITDYTNPVLTQLSTYQEGYKFYFYDTFDIDELYIDTCYYQTDGENKSCSQTLYYNQNGDYNINVTLTDLAGNSITYTNMSLTINASYTFVELNTYTLNITDFCFNTSTCTFLDLNISFNASNTSYTMPYNGETYWLRTYNNETEAENVTVLVNPLITLYFINNQTLNTINNFYINNTLFNNNYSFYAYDLGLGTHKLEFFKQGYINTSIDININTTIGINYTFNIAPVSIFIRVFDISTMNQIYFNVTIENGSILSYINQYNFSLYYPTILLGDLKFTISSDGYSDGIYYNTLNPTSSLTFDIYLFPENDTQLTTFTVTDFNNGAVLQNTLIEAQTIINASYVTIQQTKTSATGDAYLYLDPTLSYKFIFTLGGYTEAVVESIPTVTTYTIKLKSIATTYLYINNINYKFYPESNILYKNQSYNLESFISGTSITQSRFIITLDNGTVIYDNTNNNPTGTTFTYNYFINYSYNISKLYYNLTYIRNGLTFNKYSSYNIYSKLDGSLGALSDIGNSTDEEFRLLRLFVMLIVFMVFVILGSKNQTTSNHISVIVIIPIVIFSFIGWIPYLYATLLILVAIILYMGGNKR